MMMHPPYDKVTTPRRCDCAEHLRRTAEHEAIGSRDFGRGYMHAARILDERRVVA